MSFYFLEDGHVCFAGLLEWESVCVNAGGFGVVHVEESPWKG